MKFLRYFPLKPRFQRLFMSFKTAKHIRRRTDENNVDSLMRHLRDFKAWKNFDMTYLNFALKP